jgi:hypothetical protein
VVILAASSPNLVLQDGITLPGGTAQSKSVVFWPGLELSVRVDPTSMAGAGPITVHAELTNRTPLTVYIPDMCGGPLSLGIVDSGERLAWTDFTGVYCQGEGYIRTMPLAAGKSLTADRCITLWKRMAHCGVINQPLLLPGNYRLWGSFDGYRLPGIALAFDAGTVFNGLAPGGLASASDGMMTRVSQPAPGLEAAITLTNLRDGDTELLLDWVRLKNIGKSSVLLPMSGCGPPVQFYWHGANDGFKEVLPSVVSCQKAAQPWKLRLQPGDSIAAPTCFQGSSPAWGCWGLFIGYWTSHPARLETWIGGYHLNDFTVTTDKRSG